MNTTTVKAKLLSWNTELRLLRAAMDRRPTQVGSTKRARQLARVAQLEQLIAEAEASILQSTVPAAI